MTAERIYGAIKGAGTQVRVLASSKSILPLLYVNAAVVGVFRSGPVGKAVRLVDGEPDYRRIYGGLTQSSQAPLACEQFYQAAEGAGELTVLRVTDGSEIKARVPVYDRRVSLSVLEQQGADRMPTLITTLRAHNGGRWGGRRLIAAGDVTIGSAITGQTINIGGTWLKDQLAGATLRLPNDDAAWSSTVTGNTTAGVLTIQGEFSAAILAGSDGRWSLELTNTHELTGKPEQLALELTDGDERPGTEWSAYAYRDAVLAGSWTDLAMGSSSSNYWHDAIDDDARNYAVSLDADTWTGDPDDALQRPANYAEIPAPGASVTATSLRFQIVRWQVTTGDTDAYLDTVNDVTWGSDPRPCTITLTWSNATTAAVTVSLPDGGTITGMPALTLGTPYTAQHAWLPGFTIRAGTTAPDASDVHTITVRPLPAGLANKGAWLYPAAAPSEGNVRTRYRVVSNTYDTVTVASGADLTAVCTAPGAPVLTVPTAGDYDCSGSNLTLILSIGGTAAITLTETLSGASETATALAAELNALELTRAGSAAAKVFQFGVSVDDELTITALQDFGPEAVITVGAGTLNTALGLTNGDTSDPGETPTIARLQWRQELGGGYDGIASLASSDYEAAWSVVSSPLNALLAERVGGIRYAMPGVTTAAAQRAMMAYAEAAGGRAYPAIPADQVTEGAAIAWHAANLGSAGVGGSALDYSPTIWPSFGVMPSPYGAGNYTQAVIGAVLGRAARKAAREGGPHVAAAGPDVDVGAVFVDLPTSGPLNNEQLNGYGLIELRQRGGSIYPFGDRIPGLGGRLWLHRELAIDHVARILLTQTESLVFRKIDAETLALAKVMVRQLLQPLFAAGWFDDAGGTALTFEQQVEIKCDATNNPPAEREAGNLHVSVAFLIVGTAERVIFTVNPNGVSVR